MAKIKIMGQSKVKSIKGRFKNDIGVDIEIYDQEGSPAPDDVTLGSIRRKSPKSTELKIVGQSKVKTVETYFEDNYGIKVDILNPDGSLADNDVTLGETKRLYEGTLKKGITIDNTTDKGFIILSVAPGNLLVEQQIENLEDPDWDENGIKLISEALVREMEQLSAEFRTFSDKFYYFSQQSHVSSVGVLLENCGGGLLSYLKKGENTEFEDFSLSFITYDLKHAAEEVIRYLSIDEGRDDFRIRLFRTCSFDRDEIFVEIEDLSEFPEPIDDDSEKLLNDLSEEKDSSLGDDIEAYVYSPDSSVAYQCWEDGGPYGEGCLSDPDDEDFCFTPNNTALAKLLGGAISDT